MAEPSTDAMENICRISPVIASVEVGKYAHGMPLAQALVGGGVTVLEVSMGNPSAARLIRDFQNIPGVIVGAGAVLTPDDARVARDAGARFCASLGATDALLRYFDGSEMPYLPGAATLSEVMALLDRGYLVQRICPATSTGARAALSAFATRVPRLKFCASGGITNENMSEFYALPNVLNVSGDWMMPRNLVAAGDWTAITGKAAEAAALGRKR